MSPVSASQTMTTDPADGPSSLRAFTSAQVSAREAEQRQRTRRVLGQCLLEINNLTYSQALQPVLDHPPESVLGSGSSQNEDVLGSATAFYLAQSTGATSVQQASSRAPSLPATSGYGPKLPVSAHARVRLSNQHGAACGDVDTTDGSLLPTWAICKDETSRPSATHGKINLQYSSSLSPRPGIETVSLILTQMDVWTQKLMKTLLRSLHWSHRLMFRAR